MKHRVWIKRRDKIRQRYWIGKRLKNYAAFKFVSPWQQIKDTTKIDPKTGDIIHGNVEPDYARFGTRKLKMGSDRELDRLEKQRKLLQEDIARLRLQETEKVKEHTIKQKEETPKSKIPKEARIIADIKKKAENLTPEKITQRHKSAAGEDRKTERDIQKEKFEVIYKKKGYSPEKIAELVPIAFRKRDALTKKDPGGRNIGIDKIDNTSAKLAEDEYKGKQKVIPGVKTYQEPEYIDEIKKLGFHERDAQNIFFNLPSEDVINKTPQQVAKMIDKMPGFEIKEGMITEVNQTTPTVEEASTILDRILPRREDLKKHNRISVINKLRKDLTDVPSDDATLRDFFNMDKPLKEVLKDEKDIDLD